MCDTNNESPHDIFLDCTTVKAIWDKFNARPDDFLHNKDLFQWVCNFIVTGNGNVIHEYKLYEVASSCII